MAERADKTPRVPQVERRGTTVFFDGVPTLLLNSPIMTRPQDWALPARIHVFGPEVAHAVERQLQQRIRS